MSFNEDKKEAQRKYKSFLRHERRRNIKFKLIEYKGGKCQNCSYNLCQAALSFHHINSKEKEFEISDKYGNFSLSKLKKEADKCILLCRNCHFENHFSEFAPSLLLEVDKISKTFNFNPKLEKRINFESKICIICNKLFKIRNSNKNKITCSLKCRKMHFATIGWPPDIELIEMTKTMSYKEISLKIKKGISSIANRILNIKNKSINDSI